MKTVNSPSVLFILKLLAVSSRADSMEALNEDSVSMGKSDKLRGWKRNN